jgi:hypothetical protein
MDATYRHYLEHRAKMFEVKIRHLKQMLRGSPHAHLIELWSRNIATFEKEMAEIRKQLREGEP